MGQKGRSSWRRQFTRYGSLAAVIAGLMLVLRSFYIGDTPSAWYTTVIAGFVLILGGYWYAAHPFLTSERRFGALRAEINRFIDLARRLNSAATASEAQDEFERVKSAMLESVERMEKLTRKEGGPSGS